MYNACNASNQKKHSLLKIGDDPGNGEVTNLCKPKEFNRKEPKMEMDTDHRKKQKSEKPIALALEQAQQTPVPESPPTPPQNQEAGLTKDNDMRPSYWRKRNLQYIKTQLELDGVRFKPEQFTGRKEEVDFLGKKVIKTVKKNN